MSKSRCSPTDCEQAIEICSITVQSVRWRAALYIHSHLTLTVFELLCFIIIIIIIIIIVVVVVGAGVITLDSGLLFSCGMQFLEQVIKR